jgi:hypothetical protein
MNDFDQTLNTWLRGQAPQEAPDLVLDAALERVRAESQRRGWLHRFFGGTAMTITVRAAAVATAIVIVAVVGIQLTKPMNNVGPSPMPSPSAQPTESAAPSSPAESAESAEPSPEPSAAALAVQLLGGGELGPFHRVTILVDGRVITSDQSGGNAPLERRLTSNGIQLVRDDMAATGMTDTTADFSPVANVGVEPPGFIGDLGRLEISQAGGNTVVITWNLYADTEADYFQPQPEAEALQALALRLTTLEEWLPAAAWADPDPVPYVPDSYRITISGSAWGGSAADLPADVASVSWPVEVDGADLAAVLDAAEDESRCRVIDAAAGTAVIKAVQAAGALPRADPYLTFWLGAEGASRLITITLAPILPFYFGTC